jgi:hypothetical protein
VEQSKQFLSKYDTDVLPPPVELDGRAAQVFDLQDQRRLPARVDRASSTTPRFQSQDARAKVQPSEEAYVGRGKTYYHFAYSYSAAGAPQNQGRVRTFSRSCPSASTSTSRSCSHMRGEYLDLIKRLSSGEVYSPGSASIDEDSQAGDCCALKQDELLELYSRWKSQPSRRKPRGASSEW